MSKVVERGKRLAEHLERGAVTAPALQARAGLTVLALVAEIELFRYAFKEAQTCNNMAEVRELFANTLREFE